MTSQTTPTQRTFDFDITSLNRCVQNLRPKSLQTLFRGLLFAAVRKPWLVVEVSPEDGRIVLNASVDEVTEWSGAGDRTIRRNKVLHSDLVTHVASNNQAGQWEFFLSSVLPQTAIQWFVDLVEDAKCHPDIYPDKTTNVTLTKQQCHPDKTTNVRVTFSNLSSICFQLNTASLAKLAETLKSLGIAASGDEWATFRADDSALSSPEAVAAIAETVAGNEAEANRVFVAAVVSQTKERPWNYFRSLILSGNYLTTTATKQQLRTAETMLRFTNGTDAAEIVPTTGDEAWAKVLSAIARWDYMHQLEQIKAELGPQIHATVRAIGGFAKIAQTEKTFQHNNRRAFLDAWSAQQTVSTAMR